MAKVRFRQAVAQGLADEMRIDGSVVVFGEDVAEAEGPFKTSEGLLAEFGPLRVRDTPISEMGFSGAALGAAVMGLKPVIEIMFMEFLGVALDMVVTEAAKFHYMSGGRFSVPMVVRASVGSGGGFGLQHSQTLENWLVATPGLKVVVPSDVQSAYGLIRAAIRDPGPVVVMEPRILYPERDELVTGEEGLIEIGKARILRAGADATVVALGQTVSIALKAIQDSGIDAELIDLSTLVPWDRETIYASVQRTGRLVVVEEAPASGGWGHEIVSSVATHFFSSLRSAPFRITAPDVPVPYGKDLEMRYTPQPEYVAKQLAEYLKTGEPPAPWWKTEGYAS
jgi:pyruvate/2-oxoglutarate/acetoin dehydrogenase E1 component